SPRAFSAEELAHLVETFDQAVDLLARVVEGEGRAHGRRDAETIHHRLSAMMTRAHGDAFVVEDRPDIVGMDIAEDETEDARLLARGADQAQAFDLFEARRAVGEEIGSVARDPIEADLAHVAERGAAPDRSRDVRRSRLESRRHAVVDRLLEGHRKDHVAASLVVRHRFEVLELSLEDADSGRPEDLVTREGVEIAVEVADV